MIIPNLMVTDMLTSIAFYRNELGFRLKITVAADRSFDMEGNADVAQAVFAILEEDGSELMLQTPASLAGDLPSVFQAGQKPQMSGTIYLRGYDPHRALESVQPHRILKGPDVAWYGMLELYVRDPDGHIICLAAPDGPPPSS